MIALRTRLAATLAVLLLSAAGNPAPGQDHDAARAAVEAGEIHPLNEILNYVESVFAGEVIGVELGARPERPDEPWLYRIKVLASDGEVRTLLVDAKKVEIVSYLGGGPEFRPSE